jgi:two-component system response regulator HydG
MSSNGVRILIADDDALVRRSMCEVLSFEGYVCTAVSNGAEAYDRLKEVPFDILISDMKMPEMEGLDLLRSVRASFPAVAVIMVTGYGSVESAVSAMKQGAVDYISKPIIDDEIKMVIRRIIDEKRVQEDNKYLHEKLSSVERQQCCDIIGKSCKMQKIYDLIDVIAPTKTTVLIRGESGTGKRLIAHAVHYSAPDADKRPFVEVSCGALPETLLEAELFGHVKGAFTGAVKDRIGRFESAEGGTIFLDEIDAFTPALQVKLLRVLQDGEFERVGETKTRHAAVRVLAATNQDLEELIKTNRFRHDLYYRLNIIAIDMPPLRDRKEDISLLVEHFVEKHSQALGKKINGVSDEVLRELMRYQWPGNVRELENVIERACVLTRSNLIQKTDLPEVVTKETAPAPLAENGSNGTNGGNLKDALRDPEKKIILDALAKCRWNKKETAELLGINRTTLYKKMSQYGIDPSGKES